MPSVVLRPRASADLAEIWAYIADDSADHADALAAEINATFRALARHPLMGRDRPELFEGLRSFVVGSYVIFYLPFPHGVEVVRVLHGARDIEALFQDDQA